MAHAGVATVAALRSAWAALRLRGVGSAFACRLAALAEEQQGRFVLWLPVALGSGILFYFSLTEEPHPAWRLAFLPPLCAALMLARRAPGWAWLIALPAVGAAGFALAALQAARQPPMPDLPRGAAIYRGTIADAARLPEGWRITLRGATWEGGPAKPAERDLSIRLQAADPLQPEPGQRIAVRALLRPPSPPTHPGAWDFQRAAFFSGLGGAGFALAPASLLPGEGPAPPLAAIRAAVEARVQAAIPGAAGAIAAALLTGRQSAIPPPDLAAMRDSGLAHLLSVSGMHVGMVMGLAFLILRPAIALIPWLALRLDSRLLAALAALGLGAGYMVLTGAEVPMQRALAMAALAVFALVLGRRAISMRNLALAASLVLLVDPAALLGPSFQLSFAAVMALIAAYEVLRARRPARSAPPPSWQAPLRLLAGVAFTSLVAGLATLPIGLAHFGRVQWLGVIANAAAVPLTGFLVMPAGLLALIAMPVGLEAWPLSVMGAGVEALLRIAHAVAALPGAVSSWPQPPPSAFAWMALGMLWLCLWRGALRLGGLPLLAAGAIAWAMAPAPAALVSGDGRLIWLSLPDGRVLEQRLPGASRFVAEAWSRALGAPQRIALAEGAVAGLSCRGGWCIWRPEEAARAIAIWRPPSPPRGRLRQSFQPETPAEAAPCGQVAVILSPEPLRRRCEGSLVVDRFDLWRDGAHALWWTPAGAKLVSDRAYRGRRPWVPPRPLPAYVPEALPLAEAE
ncbi:MAG: ComEC/Rec2 family competence protein [Rhodovarius sp.]|nr:ComEC/Rec2 family competence protein [Rhodovarius sp.]